MERYQRESMRRIRRNSQTLLKGLLHCDVEADGDTPIPAPPRDAKMIHSIASLIRAKSKLLLLENPDTVEIYKLDEQRAPSDRQRKGDTYLPSITTHTSSLQSLKGSLTQSCPYLYDKRRGSLSSVTSQRTRLTKKQNNRKFQQEAKKSNVTVTMTYLGQSHRGVGLRSTQDELKVLQQVNGGENICVFKGHVTPGEQFQFVSQRHKGHPFSATLYVNGLMVARISSCCEYRYSPGFQQGRKSCFRLVWLAGGTPCYRCTSLRSKHSSCQQLNSTKEDAIHPSEHSTGTGAVESCPSSPLFIPNKEIMKKPKRRSVKNTGEKSRKSTDSEDLGAAGITTSPKKRRRRGHKNQKACIGEGNEYGQAQVGKGSERSDGHPSLAIREPKACTSALAIRTNYNMAGRGSNSSQDEESLSKQKSEQQKECRSDGKNKDGEHSKDFYEECVEMSRSMKQGSGQHHRFNANILERCRLEKRLSSGSKAPGSDVELSAESDSILQCNGEREVGAEPSEQGAGEEESDKERDLQTQLDAMMEVLSRSNEVEQLVLRNTDLTDELLLTLAGALKMSSSEVTLLNLNLNLLGPYGAHILLDILRAKPQVQGLHLFGNKLHDHGVMTLLNGIAELQAQTARAAAAIHQASLFHREPQLVLPQLPTGWSSFRVFTLVELDVGGNGLSGKGLKVLALYMKSHSYLQYLGLARSGGADLSAWKELFESLKGNSSLSQIILDENNLGDPGVRLLADMLKENVSLRQVDLDRNSISDVGGNDIMAALLCRTQITLRHISLQGNNISEGLLSRIQEEVKCK